ncbi:hypothetical protein BROOK1789C_268 [Bathymodiolus brooksi thiotrophic gill symbiont]|jgi:threonine/homoserine/homoserine lactone efflux protein|nr:hypothetical protein BROOK1789B_1130 [Bathymodiolus brooksi thiotrophic gill symbiont]CAB9542485.1 hypothetical protein BROOK1789C_268 [Bathymodiolus brooksi thiotrophic gill symbiont]CAC9568027.1 hypothetical protein [uncultured Gammaproteobacteria bacterium]CAC9644024.1 hypothetical protein [uncultured Gammaproteobacteria bacterium]
MNFQYFLLFFGLMFPLIFSPGPANIVCTMAGIKQGVKKSIPLITGINVVSILYSLLVGFGLDKVLKRYPDLTATLQILGALYLVYLAYKFIKPRPRQADINKTYNFWNGVILQALNPKAFSAQLLMFSMLLDGSFNQTEQVFYLIFMLTILNISTHFTWTFIGNSLSKWMTNPVAEKSLSYLFASALLLIAIWIVFYVH